MKYYSLTFLLFYLCNLSLIAQDNPVNWSFFSEKTGTNEYIITYSADVQPGWYIYSQHTEQGGPIPTAFYIEENANIELLGETGEEGKRTEAFDSLFEVNVIKFSGLVLFRQKIKLKSNTPTVAGYLEFMACDDEQCLPPKEVEFTIPIRK